MLKNETELDAALAAQLIPTFELAEHLAMLKDLNESVVKKKDRSGSQTLLSGTFAPDFDGVDILVVNGGGFDITLNAPLNLNNWETKYLYLNNFTTIKISYTGYSLIHPICPFGRANVSFQTLFRIIKKNNKVFVESVNRPAEVASLYIAPASAFNMETFFETYIQNKGISVHVSLSLDAATSIAYLPAGFSKDDYILCHFYEMNLPICEITRWKIPGGTFHKYIGYYIGGIPGICWTWKEYTLT